MCRCMQVDLEGESPSPNLMEVKGREAQGRYRIVKTRRCLHKNRQRLAPNTSISASPSLIQGLKGQY